MSDPDSEPVIEESATVYELRPDCPLCGGRLTRPWQPNDKRRCRDCGAVIRLGTHNGYGTLWGER